MRTKASQNRLAQWGIAKSFCVIAGIQLLCIGIAVPIAGIRDTATIMVSQMSFLPLVIGVFSYRAIGKKGAFALGALTLLVPFAFGLIAGRAVGAIVMVVITLLVLPLLLGVRSILER